MTRILNITDRVGNEQKVEMSNAVQGLLLWEAAKDASTALQKAHNAGHNILDTDEAGDGVSQQDMAEFGSQLAAAGVELEDAGKRIALFSEGSTGDTFESMCGAFQRDHLGPRLKDNIRMVYVNNGPRWNGTLIKEITTGITLNVGLNPDYQQTGEGRGSVPFVTVNYDEAETYVAPNGEPIGTIHLHDADLFDHSGDGKPKTPITKEMIGKVLGASSMTFKDEAEFNEQVEMIQKRIDA